MEIRFGTPLATEDGERIGAIHRIVLNRETQRLRALTVRCGHIVTRERVIGAGYLSTDSDNKSVVTTLPAEDIDLLPYLTEGHQETPLAAHPGFQSYLEWTGGERAMVTYVESSAVARQRFIPPDEIDDAESDVILLDARTVVHGESGKKIGTVAAVLCDAGSVAVSLVLKRSGVFHKGELYVPTDWAAYSPSGDDALLLEWDE